MARAGTDIYFPVNSMMKPAFAGRFCAVNLPGAAMGFKPEMPG